MPKGTRGKLQEHLEGVHRNTEAISSHCWKCIDLVKGRNEPVTESFQALLKLSNFLDETAQKIYGLI